MRINFGNNILDNAGLFVIVWNTDGNLLELNKFGEIKAGLREEEVLGMKWSDLLMDEISKQHFIKMFSSMKEGNTHLAHVGKVTCKDGTNIDILWNSMLVTFDSDKYRIIVSIGVDITEHKNAEKNLVLSYQQLEEVYEELAATEEELEQNYHKLKEKEEELRISDERYRLALEGSQDAIWDWDIVRSKSYASERWLEMLGYEARDMEVDHLTWKDLIHPDDRDSAFQAQQEHLKGKTSFYSSEYRLKMKNGQYKWILARGKALYDSEGKPIRIAGSQTDISERKNFEEKIFNMAHYDPLTGLPNRLFFEQFLAKSLWSCERHETRGAVLFLDLDNFKTVNDTFGHSAGDRLIKKVAATLESFQTENVQVARFGGDEFVILVNDAKSDQYVLGLASDIVRALDRPWVIKGKKFYGTVSMGIEFFPTRGCNVQSIVSNADCAMYSIKRDGKGSYRVYSSEMNQELMEQMIMGNNLRKALRQKEFTLHYQPQVDLVTGEVVGLEALVRWNSPSEGLVSPGSFINIAEDTGLIVPIGEWVLREACRQNRKWQERGLKKIPISVNVSVHQLKQPDIIDKIRSVLVETGLEAQWLCLEITESTTISDIDRFVEVLNAIRALGVSIALDDFGTGSSSLSYLRKLPINIIKIDRSFVNEINKNKYESAIIEAIIEMSRKIKLTVVAEGVEEIDQYEYLRKNSCNMMQGFLFSRPLSCDAIEKLIQTGEPFKTYKELHSV